MKTPSFQLVVFLLLGIVVASCGSYKQNIMFKVPEGFSLKQQVDRAEKNYLIQKNDYLEVLVYTNKGEKIIDPAFQLASGASTSNSSGINPTYLIDTKGVSKFPMIGQVKLEGLTIKQAEEVLQQAYSKFYEEPFVVLRYTNKRVIVLGAPGGQVIPLVNENIRLVEVLALAKGLNNDAKAHNIRVLRGDTVFVADLSTLDGYLKNNIPIQPGDVVYVEPIRKPLTEGLRDYGPILSIITTLTTLVVVIYNL